jgi:DNA-binding MarR family transcriptional regulator
VARITARWLLRGGIAHFGLSQSEALVLLALLDHAEGDISWVKQTDLRDHLKMARSTVQEAQSSLEARGLIAVHEPGRQGRTTRWRIIRYVREDDRPPGISAA